MRKSEAFINWVTLFRRLVCKRNAQRRYTAVSFLFSYIFLCPTQAIAGLWDKLEARGASCFGYYLTR